MVLLELLISWGRITVVGYGGGPAMIPLMQGEFVDTRGWLSEAEFLDALAMCQALPGPITAKMGTYIGFKMAGVLGAGAALTAVALPPALLMGGLAAIYSSVKDNPYVAGGMRGVRPAVLGMLAWTVVKLAPDGVSDWKTGGLALLTVAALAMRVHPAFVIIAALGIGAALLR